ncbi:MAG TPA: hypothetical protein VFN57_07115 [Thermomicrobiaceae bacterium]|nr:hypothetical protein [Thermomicrobiaceae bacterium]
MPDTIDQPNLTWRWFGLVYGTGVEQAALTESLLHSVATGAHPLVRVYSWVEPTVFIGVGEPAADVDRGRCEALGVPIVRRLSGGTAVLHGREWISVELIARSGTAPVPSDVLGAYRAFAEPIATALSRLGIVTRRVGIEEARAHAVEPAVAAACFAGLAPYELTGHGRKLVGLAQVRKRDAVILHAAVGLRFDAEALAAVLSTRDAGTAQSLIGMVTDLERESGRFIAATDVSGALRHAFVEWLGRPVVPGAPTSAETGAATELASTKYGNPGWTFRR